MTDHSIDDDRLADAVAGAHSWRGVLRELGFRDTNAARYRSVRRRAESLSLDTSHFTGQRRWTDPDLVEAVASSRSWHQVQVQLGLSSGGSTAPIRGHALRLGIDTSHLDRQPARPEGAAQPVPSLSNLARAGSLLAASWFSMCDYEVTWPLEPCRYDLLVSRASEISRIQVKTCTRRTKGFQVSLTTSGHPTGGSHARTFYSPDEIDSFFVIDGDLNYFLIPLASVGGLSTISLSAYQAFRVGRSILELPLEPQPT